MTNNLTKKISFVRQIANNMLTDEPVYTTLFTTYAGITFNSNGSFDTSRGTDIIKTTGNVTIRATANVKDIALDNLFIIYNNKHYKVTTDLYEDTAGYLKFNIESVI